MNLTMSVLKIVKYFLLVLCIPDALGAIQVKISTGVLIGEESITINNNPTYIFRGIPYAEVPINELRFKPPEKANNWTGVYNATYHRDVCTQQTNTSVIGSEDCLYINVYTFKLPTEQAPTPKLPCIVWIHGGGFITGSGNLGLHGADRFLDHGVIVISLNYRLNVFGFLSTEDAIIPGNYGLKDQILALKWIQENVAVFGGDPNNITIMGESAGSVTVSFLVMSAKAKGLFSKAIMESGTSLSPWAQARKARELAFRIGLCNGIWTANSKTLLEKLRPINNTVLIKSSTVPELLDLWDPLNGLPLGPVNESDPDEAVIIGYNYQNLEIGNFNRVPVLIGFNSLEGREAANLPWYSNLILLEQYNLDRSKLAPKDMNASPDGNDAVGQQVMSYYFDNKSIVVGANVVRYISDNEFVRGIVKSAYLHSKYTPCYLYRFAFIGGETHSSFDPEGVSHAEELQFLWLRNDTIQVTPAAKRVAEIMVTMWSNFAKTGNPTPVLNAYVNVTWPLVNATGGSVIHYYNIGDDLEAKTNPEDTQMQFWENLYTTYGYPPYNTY